MEGGSGISIKVGVAMVLLSLVLVYLVEVDVDHECFVDSCTGEAATLFQDVIVLVGRTLQVYTVH